MGVQVAGKVWQGSGRVCRVCEGVRKALDAAQWFGSGTARLRMCGDELMAGIV